MHVYSLMEAWAEKCTHESPSVDMETHGKLAGFNFSEWSEEENQEGMEKSRGQMQGALTACLPAACNRRWCPYDQSQAEAGGASSGSGPLAEHLRACSVAGKDET